MKNLPNKKINYHDLLASVCRDSFEDFVKEFWDEVPGASKLKWNWHMTLMCQELQEMAERVFREETKLYDLIFNISPGTSKSTICSILFQPWTWTRMPNARHLTASHTDSLVLDLSNKARHVIKSEKYQETFPYIQLRDDQDTKGYYANTLGGDRYTCTVAGKSPMGFHCHFATVDDPIDPKKAVSEAELANAADFMTNIIPSRKINNKVTVTILVMQRLHEGDPTGVMMEKTKQDGASKVKQFKIPATTEFEIQPPDIEKFYKDGLMDSERLDANSLTEKRISLGEYAYAGQYGQNPVPRSGGMFKEQYFTLRKKSAPYIAKRIRYWDRAASQGQGCYSAGVLISKDDEGFYIEDCVHGQWETNERNKRMLATAQSDRLRYGPLNDPIIYIEREGGSSGRDAWRAVARLLAGYKVREDNVTGSKETRAEPWSAQLAAMNVYIIDNDGKPTWDINGYIKEHCLFPKGILKDRVDASSGAFNLLAGYKSIQRLRTYSLKGKGKTIPLRILTASRETLEVIQLEQRSILVSFSDPLPVGTKEIPKHLLTHCLGYTVMNFTNFMPEDHQDTWNELILPYNLTASELIMTKEMGKSLWSFLLKKREYPPELIIFQDDRDGKALSAGMAVCDMMNLPRNACLGNLDDMESVYDNDSEVANRHIYDTVRNTRGLVI